VFLIIGEAPMTKRNNGPPLSSEEGIVVEASVALLRKAAARALFEFNEVVINKAGEEFPAGAELQVGDSLLFEEDIQPLPAQLVAIKLAEDVWYLISTSEMPPGGYPTGRDATRASLAEEKKLRILQEFLKDEAGADKVKDVRNWQPDMKAEAADVLSTIDSAKRRWVH
jgi:hypothetical protein